MSREKTDVNTSCIRRKNTHTDILRSFKESPLILLIQTGKVLNTFQVSIERQQKFSGNRKAMIRNFPN